jgi:hypothetical protein
MTSSQEPKVNEVYLPSPHGDYLITVGYDFDFNGYYVMVHNRTMHQWNERIYDIMDEIDMEHPFDMVRVNSLEAALADALLDKRYPLRLDEVIVIIGMIATADAVDIDKITNMSERKH